jgi:hypothetical protein
MFYLMSASYAVFSVALNPKKRKSWYAALKKKVVIRAVLRTECEINSNGVTAVKSQLNRDNFALNITRADLKYVK